MTRRLKRTKDFEVSLTIKSDDFIRPPREAQRNWILNRVVQEFAVDVEALDRAARQFVPGTDAAGIDDRTQGELADNEIMEDWQIPVMRAMAKVAAEAGGHVLEVGFGRGVASDFIQEEGAVAHTIVECNDSVVERFHRWRAGHPAADIRLIHAKWQDAALEQEAFDAVFFHTYPLNNEEFVSQVAGSSTFAEHFFPTAAACLKDGGICTYLTNEYDSLSREHQRALFRYFSSVTLSMVTGLEVPADTRDAMWSDSMVIVKAVK